MTRFASDEIAGDRVLVDKRLARLLSLLPEDSPHGDRLRALQVLAGAGPGPSPVAAASASR